MRSNRKSDTLTIHTINATDQIKTLKDKRAMLNQQIQLLNSAIIQLEKLEIQNTRLENFDVFFKPFKKTFEKMAMPRFDDYIDLGDRLEKGTHARKTSRDLLDSITLNNNGVAELKSEVKGKISDKQIQEIFDNYYQVKKDFLAEQAKHENELNIIKDQLNGITERLNTFLYVLSFARADIKLVPLSTWDNKEKAQHIEEKEKKKLSKDKEKKKSKKKDKNEKDVESQISQKTERQAIPKLAITKQQSEESQFEPKNRSRFLTHRDSRTLLKPASIFFSSISSDSNKHKNSKKTEPSEKNEKTKNRRSQRKK